MPRQLCHTDPSRQNAEHVSPPPIQALDAPTALFCASDVLALGAFASVWQKGKRVPEDLSIIGFDDIEEASELYPPLTTVRQPVELMAHEGFELLRSLMDEKHASDKGQQIIVAPELVLRASCAEYL